MTGGVGLHDKLTFGKRQGEKLIDVCRDDPSYIQWCVENVGHFFMDEEASDWFAKLQANLRRSGSY